MPGPTETAVLLYLSVFQRGTPGSIADYLDANRDYLGNVLNDLFHEGEIGRISRGNYHVTESAKDTALEATELTSADLLAARLVESPVDDAIMGNGEEMVVRLSAETLVVYDIGFEEDSESVGPALAFEPAYADTVDEVRERLREAFPEI